MLMQAKTQPGFDAPEFIGKLSRAGVSLTATPAGDLQARPATLLTEADRNTLRARHKAAIVAALMDDAEVI